MKIDLHCHTKLSDGAVGISELIELAALRQIDVLAVTDHDTMAGCTRAAVLGQRRGVRVIPGVEISAADVSRGRRVHILCYAPEKPERLEGLLKKITADRKAAMLVSIRKVMRLYPVSAEMILSRAHESVSIYKQHVMRALMDAGYTDEMFGDVFQKLFHPKYGLAYTKIDYPDVFEVLSLVRGAGGAAVLAHPSEYDSMELLEELCERGLLQGVEENHPRNKPEDRKTIRELCAHWGLPVTGGTDFHGGNTRIMNPLGSYLTDETQFDRLLEEIG